MTVRPNPLRELKPTPRLRRQLMERLRTGMQPDKAADSLRITWPVLRDWVARGVSALEHTAIPDEDWQHALLVIDIRQAMAEFEQTGLEQIAQHGSTRSQSWEWLLERTRQDAYAKPTVTRIGNENGQPFRISVERLETLVASGDDGLKQLKDGRAALLRVAASQDIIEADVVRELDAHE